MNCQSIFDIVFQSLLRQVPVGQYMAITLLCMICLNIQYYQLLQRISWMGNTCCPHKEPTDINRPRRSTIYTARNSKIQQVGASQLGTGRKSVYQITNPGEGTIYRGEINKDNLPHGKGEETHEDGEVYDGQFKNGVKEGKGLYKFNDGRFYEGDFKDNEMHGHGKMTWSCGDEYEGEFRHNKFEGKGVYKSEKQECEYRGYYQNGLKHGKGTMFLKGKKFEGQWFQGHIKK